MRIRRWFEGWAGKWTGRLQSRLLSRNVTHSSAQQGLSGTTERIHYCGDNNEKCTTHTVKICCFPLILTTFWTSFTYSILFGMLFHLDSAYMQHGLQSEPTRCVEHSICSMHQKHIVRTVHTCFMYAVECAYIIVLLILNVVLEYCSSSKGLVCGFFFLFSSNSINVHCLALLTVCIGTILVYTLCP